ncbi:MAG: extracellular solute-binding protein [bacterium]|nr:extracellular solute-binding protein [bacterium]
MIRSRLLLIIGVLTVGLFITGFSCNSNQPDLPSVTLTIWRVWDEEDAFQDILDAYRRQHPNVEFEYRKLRYEEYRDELLSAWARGEGPDIFSVPNYWAGEYREFMEPLPRVLELPRQETRKVLGFKTEKTIVTDKIPTYSINNLRADFAPSVVEDVVFYDDQGDQQIYALPYSVDNLALYYNRDLLNQAAIALPANTWKELLVQIGRLVKENAQGELIQSGIALGSVDNIQRYVDILSMLMVQDGAVMSTINNKNQFRASFDDEIKDAEGKKFHPGSHALSFYTDFANPSKQAFSWSEELPTAFESFTQGQLAYFLGYSYHQEMIRDAAPRLNFDVAPLPQVSLNQEANYANYWVESVYNNSDVKNWAWDFLFYATKAENVVSYLNATQQPSALREVLALQAEQDPAIEVFVNQVFTAKNWYHGQDYGTVENAFSTMIKSILDGESTPEDATDTAEKIINQNEQLKE